MHKVLVFICCVVISGAAQQSIRDVNWKNLSYPMRVEGVPAEVRWMLPSDKEETATLIDGEYTALGCSDNIKDCPLVTFDSVTYGALTGIKSTVALVALTYHSGGTATWQYVYLFSLKSSKPHLLAWLRTGSRAYQGLRGVLTSGGDLILVVSDPDKQQGDCCSAGSISTRYRWTGGSFSAIGQPIYKTDPPSFDCAKAVTPTERLICQDVELSFLDRQMAESYQRVLKDASPERKETIRRQQAAWLAKYRDTCNAPLSNAQRRDCIDQYLNDRLVTIWK